MAEFDIGDTVKLGYTLPKIKKSQETKKDKVRNFGFVIKKQEITMGSYIDEEKLEVEPIFSYSIFMLKSTKGKQNFVEESYSGAFDKSKIILVEKSLFSEFRKAQEMVISYLRDDEINRTLGRF